MAQPQRYLSLVGSVVVNCKQQLLTLAQPKPVKGCKNQWAASHLLISVSRANTGAWRRQERLFDSKPAHAAHHTASLLATKEPAAYNYDSCR